MSKILVVEDELAIRNGLVDNLEIEGYEVDQAEDGKMGLEKILHNKYNLIPNLYLVLSLKSVNLCNLAPQLNHSNQFGLTRSWLFMDKISLYISS